MTSPDHCRTKTKPPPSDAVRHTLSSAPGPRWPMGQHFHPSILPSFHPSHPHLLVEPTGIAEPLPATEPRLGRRTVLTFPLLPPPQKN